MKRHKVGWVLCWKMVGDWCCGREIGEIRGMSVPGLYYMPKNKSAFKNYS